MPELLASVRPIDITPREFSMVKSMVYDTFGMDLRQGRERLVCARLGKHIRAGGFRSVEDYLRHVQSDRSGESLVTLIDALTTNHTSFLRERDHFDFLLRVVMPELRSLRQVSIWSAACSTGEEPYSILFTLLDGNASSSTPEVRITATDISSKVVASARQGTYSADHIRALPAPWISSFFCKNAERDQVMYQVKPEYRSRIEFRRFNLMHPIPERHRYNVVFCRNVMIYFNRMTQAQLVNRLANCLEPGGYLLVGHAESLTGIDHPLKYVRPAIYRKSR